MNYRLLLLVLGLFMSNLCHGQSLAFAFLGVETDHQPDLAERLKQSVTERLGNIKKIDNISEHEIETFRTSGIFPKGMPDEKEARAITEVIGPTLFFSIYLNKVSQSASNNWWPPFSAEVQYSTKLELVLMESIEGTVLFSGSVESSVGTTKWFTSVDSPEDKVFLDAVDRDELLNTLIFNLSEGAVKRLKQVLLDFSFQKKKSARDAAPE